MEGLNHGVAALLVGAWAVPVILIGFVVGCCWILWYNYRRYHRVTSAALQQRLSAVSTNETD